VWHENGQHRKIPPSSQQFADTQGIQAAPKSVLWELTALTLPRSKVVASTEELGLLSVAANNQHFC
jgi:hypothetical protein